MSQSSGLWPVLKTSLQNIREYVIDISVLYDFCWYSVLSTTLFLFQLAYSFLQIFFFKAICTNWKLFKIIFLSPRPHLPLKGSPNRFFEGIIPAIRSLLLRLTLHLSFIGIYYMAFHAGGSAFFFVTLPDLINFPLKIVLVSFKVYFVQVFFS